MIEMLKYAKYLENSNVLGALVFVRFEMKY